MAIVGARAGPQVPRLRGRWQRWASRLAGQRLGVVLSGGATLGAFEVGVIDVLAHRGIVPASLVGTSVGAVNAAFWAFNSGPEMGSRLLRFWLELDHSTMFPDGRVPMLRRLLTRQNHLTTQEGVRRALARAFPADCLIESSPIPLSVVAADRATGQRVVLRSGSLTQALLASSAIPGLFPPVVVGGRQLVDGAVVANCDLHSGVEAGMTDLLAVDVMGDRSSAHQSDIWEVAEGTVHMMLRRQTDLAAAALVTRARIAVLRPTVASPPRLGDFAQTLGLYHLGRAAAEAFLPVHLSDSLRVRPGLFEFSAAPSSARRLPAPLRHTLRPLEASEP